MTTTPDSTLSGGAFLSGPTSAASVFTPEQLSDEHRAIARTVDAFWARDVQPALGALLAHEPGVARRLLRHAASLGLTAMEIPEPFGGLDLDLSAVMLAAEHLSTDASYSGWHLGHSGIGTLPLVFYGTPEQQRRYLPRLATAEMIAAYALTEPHAGSDALAARTRADLSPDGRHYVLNGTKAWITNGAEADLFTLFAQVGGQHFTAFVVERAFGVKSGAEEHKMGLAGTSTTPLYLDRVAVPVENVLGEVGRGHVVALNVLNTGRLKMGPLAIRGATTVLAQSTAYAKERRAFGRTIGEFGAVREMLADCAIDLFAIESATWRVVGLIEAHAAAGRLAGSDGAAAKREAFAEFAAECAIVKVAASEMLDRVCDRGVQIHGGMGYHRDSLVERAYRDARINRIFEGTNEINRLTIPDLVLKRTARAVRPLEAAARAELARLDQHAGAEPATDNDAVVERARTLARLALGALVARHGDAWRNEQELVTRVADLMIETFVMESALRRAERMEGPAATRARAMATVYAHEALRRLAGAAENVCVASLEGDVARAAVSAVRALGTCLPVGLIRLKTIPGITPGIPSRL